MLAINGGTPVRTKPFTTWPVHDEREEQAVVDVVRSGKWGLGGTRIGEFESRFASYQNAQFGVAVANGTVALQIALAALNVGPGDEVIIPGYTFVATGAAVLHSGATPVIVDIDPDTYTIDPDAVEAAITSRTKCIIPVHVAGNICDMTRIQAIATKHEIPVLEDAAQAHGARWEGKGAGSIGTMGTFSFQASKNLNAGEGGIILTNDETLAHRSLALRNCGRSQDPNVGRMLGWNYRMTEFQAAILLAQMERLDEQTDRRQRNAEYLTAALQSIPGIRPLTSYPSTTRHAYHLYVFRYDEKVWGIPLTAFLRALAAEGIPSSTGYVPLYRDPLLVTSGVSSPAAWPQLGNRLTETYGSMVLPHAEQASKEAVWLSQQMLLGTESDMDDIASAVRKLWDGRQHIKRDSRSASDDSSVRYVGLEG